jgi:membrane protease YdiL (CAAX protease family)
MPSLTRAEYDVVLLAASWLIGFAPLLVFRKRWTWVQCVGLALLASPFVRFLIGIYLTIVPLFTQFTVLQPISRAALWSGVQATLFQDLVVPAVGLWLMHQGRVDEALDEHGLAPKASWRRDALRGLALFFAIAIAYVVAYFVSKGPLAALSYNGDESQYWRNITIPLILLVSGAAGVTEELLFRGVLLSWLSKRIPWLAAALLQAVFFGLVHAGYGTFTHVVGPFVFGLGMAWVARVLGVLPAALLHAEVNVMFFALEVAPTYVAVNGAWGLAAIVGLVAAWGAACVVALWVTRADAVRLLWRSLRLAR